MATVVLESEEVAEGNEVVESRNREVEDTTAVRRGKESILDGNVEKK